MAATQPIDDPEHSACPQCAGMMLKTLESGKREVLPGVVHQTRLSEARVRCRQCGHRYTLRRETVDAGC